VLAQPVLYVDDDAPPAGDGLSWVTAYRFLQDALADAVASGGAVTEILVAQGTYPPDRDELNPDGTGDRSATFQLSSGVALIGGFAGTGAGLPNERDVELYESILSGEIGAPGTSDNSYHVVTGSGTDSSAVIDGFTITGGNADDSAPDRRGGGMYNEGGSPTVIDCKFVGNSALVAGGGMINEDGHPVLIGCSFVSNRVVGGYDVGKGGAMYNSASHPTVINCLFLGNVAGSPSALCINPPYHVIFRGGQGGGMYNGNSDLALVNCLFSGNIARSNCCSWNDPWCDCDQWMCGGGEGDALLMSSGAAVIANCTFASDDDIATRATSNTLIANSIMGGGIYNATWWTPSSTTVTFSLLTREWPGPGSHNIIGEPLFVDPDHGDYRLAPGSPCIDAGNNAAVPIGTTTDLQGNPRIADDPTSPDSGHGGLATVDMGAYELQAPCPWDLDGDGTVSLDDILGLLDSFGPCADPDDCPADFDGSGDVGVTDLFAQLASYGSCPGAVCRWDLNGDQVVGQPDLDAVLNHLGPCPEDEACPPLTAST
jgi:hypothetical protein